jgi:hypothetical protein
LLFGKAAANSSVPAIFADARSGLDSKLAFRAGPLTVDFDDACDARRAGDEGRGLGETLRFFMSRE